MSYGPIQVFATTGIVSGASTLTIFTLPKAFSQLYCEFGTFSTAAETAIYGSSDGSTFRPVFERINTAPVQYQTLVVGSGIASSGGLIPISVYQVPYLQFRTSAVVSGGVTLKIIGVD